MKPPETRTNRDIYPETRTNTDRPGPTTTNTDVSVRNGHNGTQRNTTDETDVVSVSDTSVFVRLRVFRLGTSTFGVVSRGFGSYGRFRKKFFFFCAMIIVGALFMQ